MIDFNGWGIVSSTLVEDNGGLRFAEIGVTHCAQPMLQVLDRYVTVKVML